ncbi:MAG: hypothetical protein AAF694_08515 [Bacteroidota bacterium]
MAKNYFNTRKSPATKLGKNFLVKAYYNLPLWGKVAVPVGLLLVAVALVQTVVSAVKYIFVFGLLGLVVYLVLSAWSYFKRDKENTGRY